MDVPVMYQGGTRDIGESPVIRKTGGAYDKSSKPKFYVEFEGAGHLAWTNLNRTYQRSINVYSVAFFDAYLKGKTHLLTELTNGRRADDVSGLRVAQ